MDAAEGKVGASDMPNIFAAYADTAYALDQKGFVVDIGKYLTDDEKKLYIESFLDEGDCSGDGSIKIFPTVKSTIHRMMEKHFSDVMRWQTICLSVQSSLALRYLMLKMVR